LAEHLDKGTFGEQGAGFFLGSQGYFLIEGPGGTSGHVANAPGFDGVAYNIKSDHLIIYDNKTFASERNVGQGTAIDPGLNLAKNLDTLVARVQQMRDLPARYRILDLLRQTRAGVSRAGVSSPRNVQIAIANFGSNSSGITRGLAGRGITFINMDSAPTVPKPASRTSINETTIPAMAQPADGGAGSYGARRAKVHAAAEATRFVAQGLNDYSLKYAIDRELQRLAGPIGEAIVGGGGALVVVNIDGTSPPGNVGMVVARSISSAYVVAHPNSDRQQAVMFWENQPKLGHARPPHVTLETRLLWIAAPKMP